MTRVYGLSDDLIEFEGDVRGEVDHYFAEERQRSVKVTMSDGTVLLIRYGKINKGVSMGVWQIQVKVAGPLFDSLELCFDPDAPLYSDVAHFKDGLTGARCKGERVR